MHKTRSGSLFFLALYYYSWATSQVLIDGPHAGSQPRLKKACDKLQKAGVLKRENALIADNPDAEPKEEGPQAKRSKKKQLDPSHFVKVPLSEQAQKPSAAALRTELSLQACQFPA